jgi:kinesin family member C1
VLGRGRKGEDTQSSISVFDLVPLTEYVRARAYSTRVRVHTHFHPFSHTLAHTHTLSKHSHTHLHTHLHTLTHTHTAHTPRAQVMRERELAREKEREEERHLVRERERELERETREMERDTAEKWRLREREREEQLEREERLEREVEVERASARQCQSELLAQVSLLQDELKESQHTAMLAGEELQKQMEALDKMEREAEERARAAMDNASQLVSLQAVQADLDASLEQLQAAQDAVEAATREKANLRQALQEAEERLASAGEEAGRCLKLQDQVATLERSLQERQKESEELERKKACLEEDSNALEQDHAQLQTKVLDLTQELASLHGAYAETQEERDRLEAKVKEQQAGMQTHEAALQAKETDLWTALASLQQVDVDKSSLQEEMSQLQQRLRRTEEECEQARLGSKEVAGKQAELATELAVANAKLDGLRQEHAKTAAALEEARESAMKFKLEKQMLDSKNELLQEQVDRSEQTARTALADVQSARQQAEMRVADLNTQLQLSLFAVSAAKDEARAAADKIDALQAAKYEATEKLAVLNAEYKTFKDMSQDPTQIADQLRQVLEFEKSKAADECRVAAAQENAQENKELVHRLREQVHELEGKLVVAENTRRQLHNQLQELKGNIRIFTRVRPGEEPVMLLGSDGEVDLCLNDAEHSFKFDRAFTPQHTQEDVFAEVSQFVQSAVDGYNVSLFAYGQTGSGKTHTMFGTGPDVGIIPRSMDQILLAVVHQQEQGWSFELNASFIEIYLETVRDLLCCEKDREGKQYRIVAAAHGRHMVTDAVEMPVASREDLDKVIDIANSNKTVAKTDMNARSSRSHTVFTLRICGSKTTNNRTQEINGTLHLVDLAGSERLDKSNAVGVQLKEAQAINKSLSALSDVFVALSKKSPHVPYRNSKLTFLLQPCLSGDGKALVIANLAPEASSAHESLCTLRFASMVSSCELGKAVKHTSVTSAAPSGPSATRSSSTSDDASADSAAPCTPCRPATASKIMATPNNNSSQKLAPSNALRRRSKSCDDIGALSAVDTPSRLQQTPTATSRGGGVATPRASALPPSGLKTPGARPASAAKRAPASSTKR